MGNNQSDPCLRNCFKPELPILQPMKSKDKGGNAMTLYAEFCYYDPDGKKWLVPKGAPTDGASIPKWLWPILGHPFDPEFVNAAIVHDHYCRIADKSDNRKSRDSLRKEADIMFYYACICDGCSIDKAFSMFKGVRIGASMPWSPGKETKAMESEQARSLYSRLSGERNIFEDALEPWEDDRMKGANAAKSFSGFARESKSLGIGNDVDYLSLSPASDGANDIKDRLRALDEAIAREASMLDAFN